MLLTVVEAGPLHDWPRLLLETTAGLWLYPVIATAAIVAAALGAEAIAKATGFGWLFRLPAQTWPYRFRNATSRARSVLSV